MPVLLPVAVLVLLVVLAAEDAFKAETTIAGRPARVYDRLHGDLVSMRPCVLSQQDGSSVFGRWKSRRLVGNPKPSARSPRGSSPRSSHCW